MEEHLEVKEKDEKPKIKGTADSQTVSQFEQQARPSQWWGECKTWQAQGRDSIENVEPEMGDDPPSQYLADQSDSTKPREVGGGHKAKRPNLGGAIDVIRSAVRLRRLVGGRSIG